MPTSQEPSQEPRSLIYSRISRIKARARGAGTCWATGRAASWWATADGRPRACTTARPRARLRPRRATSARCTHARPTRMCCAARSSAARTPTTASPTTAPSLPSPRWAALCSDDPGLHQADQARECAEPCAAWSSPSPCKAGVKLALTPCVPCISGPAVKAQGTVVMSRSAAL